MWLLLLGCPAKDAVRCHSGETGDTGDWCGGGPPFPPPTTPTTTFPPLPTDTAPSTTPTTDSATLPEDTGDGRVGDDRRRVPRNQTLRLPPPGLTENDPGRPPHTVVAFDPAGDAGGLVAVDPDGGLTYTPPPTGGPDRFRYTVTDAVGSFFDIFVEIEVLPPVRFVDNTAPPPGDGTLDAPFPDLRSALVGSAGEPIVVLRGDGTPRGLDADPLPDGVPLHGTRGPCDPCGDLPVPIDDGPVLQGPIVPGIDGALFDLTVEGDPSVHAVDSAFALGGVRLRGAPVSFSAIRVDVTTLRDVTLEGDLEAQALGGTFDAELEGGDVLLDGASGTVTLTGTTGRWQLSGDLGGVTGTVAISGPLVLDGVTGPVSLGITGFDPTGGAPLVEIRGGAPTLDLDFALATSPFDGPILAADGAGGITTLAGVFSPGSPGSPAFDLVEPAGMTLALDDSVIQGFDDGLVGLGDDLDALRLVSTGTDFINLSGSALQWNLLGSATLDLAVTGGTFSGLGGSAVNLGVDDAGVLRAALDGVAIASTGWDGAAFVAFGGGAPALDVTVTGSTLDATDLQPVPWNRGALSFGAFGGATCLRVEGNTVTNPTAPAAAIAIEARTGATAGFYDPLRVGAVGGDDVFAVNALPPGGAVVGGTGTVSFVNTACALP